MKKIITTLTAVTFALGLAAAAQAQVTKTPEKPAAPSTQTVQPQAAPKHDHPGAKEAVKPGDKTKEAATTGVKDKTKPEVKKDTKKADPKGSVEKKAGAPMEKTPESAK